MSMSGDIQQLQETVREQGRQIKALQRVVEDLSDSLAVVTATGDTVSAEEAEKSVRKGKPKGTAKAAEDATGPELHAES